MLDVTDLLQVDDCSDVQVAQSNEKTYRKTAVIVSFLVAALGLLCLTFGSISVQPSGLFDRRLTFLKDHDHDGGHDGGHDGNDDSCFKAYETGCDNDDSKCCAGTVCGYYRGPGVCAPCGGKDEFCCRDNSCNGGLGCDKGLCK